MSIQNLRGNLAHAKKIQQPTWASCASRGEVEAALTEHDALTAEVERLRQELGYIANAKHGSIECEFRAWAQNRARHALNQKPGTLTVKKEKA